VNQISKFWFSVLCSLAVEMELSERSEDAVDRITINSPEFDRPL
jgi:hypothetical protein